MRRSGHNAKLMAVDPAYRRKKMRKFLLYSSALVVSGLLCSVAEAACIQTPSCSSLGYTSSQSCNGGVKCPFGNAWNCTAAGLTNKITEVTNKITEITNKITTIEEKITEIEENGGGSGGTNPAIGDCVVGAILNADKTCSSEIISGKTPIGVVFNHSGKLAIGLEESRKYWSNNYFDVPSLPNLTTYSEITADWQGKNNTRLVLEYCKTIGESCPAFEYVNSYKTEGTKAGDWYLPAMGELIAIHKNRDVLNTALGKIGATKVGTDWYWSSSQHSNTHAWFLTFTIGSDYNDYVYNDYKNNGYGYVRPVLAF